MKEVVKKYFIPHEENDFHPHILHRKRSLFYGGFFLTTKIIALAFVALVTPQAFILPEVMAEEQKQITALTNKIRAEKGIATLAVNGMLDTSSRSKAQDMAANSYFAHTKDGKNLSYWISNAGYRYVYAGENLAVGFRSAEEIVAAWQKSPTHYANLIDADYVDLGVGLASGMYKGEPAVFIAQHLAAPEKLAAQAAASTVPIQAQRQPELLPKTPAVSAPTSPKEEISTAPQLPWQKILETATLVSPAGNTASEVAGQAVGRTVEFPAVVDARPSNLFQRYLAAKEVMTPVANIFKIEQAIYLSALIFFSLALVIMVFVAIRVQRPRAIAWTCALLGFLVFLWRF